MTCRRSPGALPLVFWLEALALGCIVVACAGPRGPTCGTEQCFCGPEGCACPNGSRCGWTLDVGCAADGSGCHLQCTGGTCLATCTVACEAGCTEGATCDVIGTEGTTLFCSRSTCDVAGSAGTIASCRDGATCRVHCEERPCGVDCSEDSTCTLRCPGDASFRTVTGNAGCP